MKLGLKFTAALVVGLLIISAVGAQSYMEIQWLTDSNRSVMRSHEVLEHLGRALSAIERAQTAERGFVLTGEAQYLAPYETTLEEVQKNLASVAPLTEDIEQQRNLEQLQKLSGDEFVALQRNIRVRRETGLEAALAAIRAGHGEQIMADIRTLVAAMELREQKLLEARNREARMVARQSVLVVGFGMLLSLAMLGIAAVVVSRTTRLTESMLPDSYGSTRLRAALRYPFALAVVALATWVHWLLEQTIGPMSYFLMFYPAVLVVATIAGGGPGIVATLASALACDYWFIPPPGFGIGKVNDAVALGIFTGTGIFLSLLAERVRRARWAEAIRLAEEQKPPPQNEEPTTQPKV